MQKGFDRTLTSLEVRQPVLLAVSGGVDSMTMADLFLHSSMQVRFAVAHCNFHLRGEDSDADERLVAEWAESHGIEFFKTDFNTTEHASAHGLSIEMAARELRYSWFEQVCRENGFRSLAVAHNQNDNAETMVLNMLRGTGVRGMAGMRRTSALNGSEIALVRPLLGFSRKEIEEYAVKAGLQWREDRTNADSDYKRNRIRNEIFPLFEKINPSFLDTMTEDAERFSMAQDFSDICLEGMFQDVVDEPEAGEILRVSIVALKEYSGKVSVEYILYNLLDRFGFSPAVARSLATLVEEGETVSGKRFSSDANSIVTTSSHILVFRNEDIEDGPESLVIGGPGEYSLGRQRILVDVFERSPGMTLRQPSGTLVFDADTLDFPLLVRHWKEGDWMCPFGMKGRKKLSDMFVDLKYSLVDKQKALVLQQKATDAPAGRVAALLGERIDDRMKVARTTRTVLKIVLL